MKYALPVSIIAHIAIGASGLLVWTNAPRAGVETFVEVPLDIVNIAEETNIREVRRPEPETQPEPEEEEELIDQEGEDEEDTIVPADTAQAQPEPEEIEDVPPPPPEEPPEEETPPEPEEEEPEPVREDPPEAPVTRAPEPEPENDDPFGDLIDEVEETLNQDVTRELPTRRNRNASTTELEDQDQEDQRGAGAQTGNTATVVDFIVSYIEEQDCWRSVSDLPDWQNLDVTVSFRLDAEGNITRSPRVTGSSRPVNSDRFIRTAADRAIRAIRNCEPFPMSEQNYEFWRDEDIVLTFNEDTF